MDPVRISSDQEIKRAATEWLSRRDRGLTPSEQDEFFQWLSKDPRHGEWYARAQVTWSDLKVLVDWRPEHGSKPNPDLLAIRRKRTTWFIPFSLATAAALTLGFYIWKSPGSSRSQAGESIAQGYEQRILEDGSTVELNRGAAVDVRFTPAERHVVLLSGEAHFIVAKNANRPFIVQADGISVRAVGTAFDVRLDTREVAVLVTEGEVQVGSGWAVLASRIPTAGGSSADIAPSPIMVTAGERATVSRDPASPPAHVVQVSDQEIARLLAWQPRQLEFDSTPLSQVVAEFNRHNQLQMVIADPAINSIPIGATFRSDNVDAFVRLLEASFHVKAERGEGRIILRNAP